MLFEHISDRPFRASHREAGGFCPFHSRNLVSFRDGLAVAILSRDILEDRIHAIENRRPWRPKGRCPICVEQEKITEEYLGFLAGANGDSEEEKELREIFCVSDGLCAPHYTDLLFTKNGKPRKFPSWLKEFQETKFRRLLERVSRFIEFSSYGRQEEFASLSEEDQTVWKEAAAVLRGSNN